MSEAERATRERILDFAMAEFLEHGFKDASLRNIAKAAGVTTGAFYWHFKSKEALFEQLVAPAVENMERWLARHIARNTAVLQGGGEPWLDTEIDLMRDVVYPDMDRYRLLLTRAQGTKHESFLSDLVETHQREMLLALPLFREKGYPVREISENELHILISAYTTALFEPVIHGFTLQEAERAVRLMEDFFLPGWRTILGF